MFQQGFQTRFQWEFKRFASTGVPIGVSTEVSMGLSRGVSTGISKGVSMKVFLGLSTWVSMELYCAHRLLPLIPPIPFPLP